MSPRHLDGDGWRARVGIVVPSVNTVMEPWAQRVVPAGVGLYFSRMFIPPDTTAETLIEMDRTEGKAAIRQLSSVHPHVIAYGCTASSIVQGLNYDAHLRAEIAETHHTASTTAAHAILTALKTVGASTVSLVSPYTMRSTPPSITISKPRVWPSSGALVSASSTASSWPRRRPETSTGSA